MTSFEDRLWESLSEDHDADLVVLAAPRERSHHPSLIVGGGLTAAAAITAAAIVGIGAVTRTPPAYAMTQSSDGTVTVTINDLSSAIPALNARFAAMGIDETVVPVESGCSANGMLFVYPNETASDTLTFNPGRKNLLPGYMGFVAAEQLPNGQVALAVGAMKPPIPNCISSTTVDMNPQTGQITGGSGTLTDAATGATTTVTITTQAPVGSGL